MSPSLFCLMHFYENRNPRSPPLGQCLSRSGRKPQPAGPRCSHRPRAPGSARSQSLGGAGSAGIGSPEAVRQGPGLRVPPPSGRFKSNQSRRVNKPWPRPPMHNTSGRREAHRTPRGRGAGLSGGHTPRPGPMGGQTPPPALAALRTRGRAGLAAA